MRRSHQRIALSALVLAGCSNSVGDERDAVLPGVLPNSPAENPAVPPANTPPHGDDPAPVNPIPAPPSNPAPPNDAPPPLTTPTPVDSVPPSEDTTGEPPVMPPNGAPIPSVPDAANPGYSKLPDGRGGFNVEAVVITEGMGFDKARSLEAFKTTLYPLLRENCSGCHSTENSAASGAQAPIHADVDPALAHEYALTRVNFRKPEDSKFVVRMGIDRHNCFGASCKDANAKMLEKVKAWAAAIVPTLPATARTLPAETKLSEDQVQQWIRADKAKVLAADAEYVKYTSLHELHNAGVSADELNQARVGLSKALNSVARWAPKVVNPVDVSDGKGIVYRFDTRDYWGYNKGVTELLFGGSDDDIAFALEGKKDYLGKQIAQSEQSRKYPYTSKPSDWKAAKTDPAFAKLIWNRILAGNVEGAVASSTLKPNVDGFKTDYVEAAQLVYTVTRPDVYNAIMAIPWWANELEDELGVDKSRGAASYEHMVTFQAITVDSRLYWRANTTSGGSYWKTWDVFSGQLPEGNGQGDMPIEEAYEKGFIRFPFWANPIPKFIRGTGGGVTPETLSFIATLAQPFGNIKNTAACDPQTNFGGDQFKNCRYYTGEDGLQQSAEEIIWTLPNGLNGYQLAGGFNQRRVDAFVNIVRDPRVLGDKLSDAQMASMTGFIAPDNRLNTGSSCLGCHADGYNRGTNDLRDWLDAGGAALPKGEHGVDGWINDESVKAKVRELYPPSSVMRPRIEADRERFLAALAPIKAGMILGTNDKNVYVEPTIWTIEWAQKFYKYPQTRSN